MKIHDQKTADKIMNRARDIAKGKDISLASAVGVAQNEESGAADEATQQCQKRAMEMRAENPNLSLATCLGMAIHEYRNQQQNLGI